MTWHYQVMKRVISHDPKEVEYHVHEFYLDGVYVSWTENRQAPFGETLEELIHDASNMLEDIKRYGVRDYDTGELLDEKIP